MTHKPNIVRVFVHSPSEPIRRRLFRLFDEIPLVELVGTTNTGPVPPHMLTELQPDLLLLNLEARDHTGWLLLGEAFLHLPNCKAIVLAKGMGANEPARDLDTDLEPHSGNAISAVVDPDDCARLQSEVLRSIEEQRDNRHAEFPSHPDGSVAYLYDYVDYISTVNEEKTYSSIVRNIAERRRKHAGRRHDEIDRAETAARFQAFVEQLPGLPYVANLDSAGSSVYVSPRIKDVLGFSPAEWCNDPGLRIRQLHADDRKLVLGAIRKAIAENTSYSIDYRIHAHGGAMHWFHDEARVTFNQHGTPLFLQGTMLDITERKQAQAELERSHNELQELITVLDSLRAEEQRRLAQEMHDDFGQLLAAMKIDLCTLRQHLPKEDAESVRYLSSINDLVDTMVTSVRRIIADLPPKIVEDLGLFGAVTSLTRNFEKRHQIICRLQITGREPELETRMATAMYRMVQEALTNIVKHAMATSVDIRIDCDSECIALRVTDNGRGIDAACLRKAGSFGLVGMRERIAALGGELRIDGDERTGTSLRIVVPLRHRD